jgi:hypothetical protein
MDLTPHLASLRADLTASAAVGGPESAQAAALLLGAVEPALRLVLLDLLAEAADDVSAQLGGVAVEVRLRGREPELVVHAPASPVAEPEALGEEGTARLTLRLPETLKARVEDAAATGGTSVNTWLVRAVGAALDPHPTFPFGAGHSGPRRITGFGRT